MPILFSIILVTLDIIQSHLENPFDLEGEDDVYINVDKFIKLGIIRVNSSFAVL